MTAHVRWLVNNLAAAEHAIAGEVGTNVEILGKGGEPEIARVRCGKQRTRLRVELTETQKVGSNRFRQNGEIALNVAGRHTCGLPAELAAANGKPGIAAGLRNGRDGTFHAEDGHASSKEGGRGLPILSPGRHEKTGNRWPSSCSVRLIPWRVVEGSVLSYPGNVR